jgi:Spy/CpxP family protein refolding chaperone
MAQTNKKNRILTIGLVILILINVSALITIGLNSRFFRSEGLERTDRSFQQRGMQRRDFEKMLDLDGEQQEKFSKLRQSERMQVNKLMKEMTVYRGQLNEELAQMELDLEKIEEINLNIVATDTKIRNQATIMNIEIRKILDEKQKMEFLKMMKSRKHGGRRDGRRGGPPPPQGFIDDSI